MKVWILEGYVTPEMMQESKQTLERCLADARERGDAKGIEAAEELLEVYKKRIAENPDGYWLGYAGKINYRAFCEDARVTVRHMKDMKFRVLKADLKDEKARYWMCNYTNGEENPGVLRYLYATARQYA